MDNYTACEKLSDSFVNFLDSKKINKFEYRIILTLNTPEKMNFINQYLKPYKNNIDQVILDAMDKNGDKLENYQPDDIEKLKEYLNAFVELV